MSSTVPANMTSVDDVYSFVRMGVGYDRLDRVALAERGVIVCNVPGKHALRPSLSLPNHQRSPFAKS
jgi:lactate dehydrogenase-like 2-hydroxyacid dehydrogenase